MDPAATTRRIAALRAECAALGRELAEAGSSMTQDEAFAVAGALQGVVNAAEGAQGAAAAWAARVEFTLHESRPWERVHPVGFVDGMAAAEVSLATGVTEGLAQRKVRLGAALADRFPTMRGLVLDGAVGSATAHKVLDACAGLDHDACRRVDTELAGRLPTMDPARVASQARATATRVAADQVQAHVTATRRGRSVEVRPGEDGLTEWYATLPTATAAAAWSAIDALATEYRQVDDTLTVSESRADAFGDLLLRSVHVTAKVTLGVPVVTGDQRQGLHDTAAPEWEYVEHTDDETFVDGDGRLVRYGDLTAEARETLSWHQRPAAETIVEGPWGPQLLVDPRSTAVAPAAQTAGGALAGAMVSGAAVPGLGWVDSAVMAGILSAVPLEVGRAVLDAETGVLTSTTTAAYTPPRRMREHVTTRDGTCRMWGCSRPALRCDLDHNRPWPEGATSPQNLVALCRRHHRMKQQTRWRPVLDPDTATLIWHGPDGRTLTTEPEPWLLPAHRDPGAELQPAPPAHTIRDAPELVPF